MRRLTLRLASLAVSAMVLGGCYTASAMRQSERIVRAGFDFDEHGPWVLIFGPGAVVLAAGNLALGSLVPLHGEAVDPREPEAKWFHAYEGEMRPPQEVAILCHRERATWVTGIRTLGSDAWTSARNEKWHFPVCIEALPGRYELEVHYFARETDDDREQSVSRQAESTSPTFEMWEAEAGRVYLLSAQLGEPEPTENTPPQRHIPRSRALGTSWWELEESDWQVQIESVAAWEELSGPVVEQRRAWVKWDAHLH
jgi:hypothetical protein